MLRPVWDPRLKESKNRTRIKEVEAIAEERVGLSVYTVSSMHSIYSIASVLLFGHLIDHEPQRWASAD